VSTLAPHQPVAPPLLLTPKEVSEALGVATQTLAKWRSDGTGMPYIKLGGAVRYRADEVAAWVDANTVVTEVAA